jgi:replication factor C subunit 1
MDYMDTYFLDRENLDTLSDLTFVEKGGRAPIMELPTKVKSAFTRQ